MKQKRDTQIDKKLAIAIISFLTVLVQLAITILK
jgi:hypothetical protein